MHRRKRESGKDPASSFSTVVSEEEEIGREACSEAYEKDISAWRRLQERKKSAPTIFRPRRRKEFFFRKTRVSISLR
jgi:hypothetical protein